MSPIPTSDSAWALIRRHKAACAGGTAVGLCAGFGIKYIFLAFVIAFALTGGQ